LPTSMRMMVWPTHAAMERNEHMQGPDLRKQSARESALASTFTLHVGGCATTGRSTAHPLSMGVAARLYRQFRSFADGALTIGHFDCI
jgi:hypothetical protein